MADTFADWKHRWFGYWQLDLSRDAGFPTISSFIDDNVTLSEDEMNKLYAYLCGGKTMILNYDIAKCMFPDCEHKMLDVNGAWLTMAPTTDGIWIWPRDLYHYVRYHSVRIPDNMYHHIRLRNFELPHALKLYDTVLRSLDWPFVPPPVQRRLDHVQPNDI